MHGTINLNDFIDRSNFSDAEVLTALIIAAIRPSDAISINYSKEPLSVEKIQQYLNHSQKLYLSMQNALSQIDSPKIRDLYSNRKPTEITHMFGRVLNVDLSDKKNLYVRDYDLHNGGRGTARRALDDLSEVRRNRSTSIRDFYMSADKEVNSGLPTTVDQFNGLPIQIYDDKAPSGLEVIADVPHQPSDQSRFELR